MLYRFCIAGRKHAGGGGAVALVVNTGAATNSSFAGTITTSVIDTTGVDFLAVVVSNYGTTPATLVDSKANTWQQLGRYADYCCPQIFYCYNPTVGVGHTFTAAQAGADIAVAVGGFSGLNTTSAVFEPGTDMQSPVNEATASVQAGSISPANVGDLVIAGFGGLNPTGPDTIDSSFSITDSPGFGHIAAGALAYFIVTAPGAVNPTWTVAANNNRIAATIAAFAHA